MENKNSEVKTKKLLLRDLYKDYDSKHGSVGDDIHEDNDTLISPANIQDYMYDTITSDYSFSTHDYDKQDGKKLIENLLTNKENINVSDEEN